MGRRAQSWRPAARNWIDRMQALPTLRGPWKSSGASTRGAGLPRDCGRRFDLSYAHAYYAARVRLGKPRQTRCRAHRHPVTVGTVGVDVGGTKVAAAVVDKDGQIIATSRAHTESSGYSSMVAGIVRAVSDVVHGRDVDAVGLAIAGNVTADGSQVLFSPHLPLAGEPICADLQSALGFPVVVENDANAAAWAETTIGSAT